MNHLGRVLELIEEHSFDEAMKLALQLVQDKSLVHEERIEIYRLILKYFDTFTHPPDKNETAWQLAECYFTVENYQDAAKIFQKYPRPESEWRDYWSSMIISHFHAGELEQSRKICRKYFKVLSQKKNGAKLTAIIKRLEEIGFYDEAMEEYKLRARFYSGDLSIFKEGLEQQIRQPKNAITQFPWIYSELKRTLNPEYKCLKALVNIVMLRSASNYERKEYITSIIEVLISGGQLDLVFDDLVQYTMENRRREMALVLSRAASEKGVSHNKEMIQQMIKNLPQYGEYESSLDDLDFGEDLFKSESPAKNRRDVRISRVVSQIVLLEGRGQEERVNQLLAELKELDEEHDLLKRFEEQRSSKQGSMVKSARRSVDEVRDSLISEIERAIPNRKKSEHGKDEVINARNIIKQLELMDATVLKQQGKDLVYCFLSLDLPGVVIWLLDAISKSHSLSVLEDAYLRATCLAKQEEWHKAYDLVTDVLQSETMNKEERVTFIYLKAELAKQRGLRAESISLFQEVERLRPGYRLAKKRLEQLASY